MASDARPRSLSPTMATRAGVQTAEIVDRARRAPTPTMYASKPRLARMGLDPAIHSTLPQSPSRMDARVEPAHDESEKMRGSRGYPGPAITPEEHSASLRRRQRRGRALRLH